jgi:glycosyltransferase involved in cell wall biosynthesis
MMKIADIKAVVVTHVTISEPSLAEVYGQCHAIADFLKENAQELLFIRHPLNGKFCSRAERFSKDTVVPTDTGKNTASGIMRYIADVLTTLKVTYSSSKSWDVFIGVNSLNAFSGILLKRMKKVKRVIFYTADYVPLRFKNRIMNSTYHWFDRFCIRNADFVWNISQAQVAIRRTQGVSDAHNIHVPHGIDTEKIKPQPVENIDRFSFVIAANLTRAFNHTLILDAFSETVKRIPHARLFIVGTGESEQEIQHYINLKNIENSVFMEGWMPHEKLLAFLSRCGVGIAIYTSECSWTNFSDSFKTKEYLGCGCPVIISGAQGAISEAKESNALIVVEQTKDSLSQAMLKMLQDEAFYMQCRKNAINFMKNLDWRAIYGRSLKFLNSN